ncbi:MAG: DnaD domain protein [Ruminococcaceae bacterium]|nr:DnaD domain protein [Oscillospiraceae bacterium]
MELKWNYGQGVLVLPTSVLSQNATEKQLQVLLWLASDADLFSKPTQLARLAGVSKPELEEILRFWQDCAVLSAQVAAEPIAPPAKKSGAEATPPPKKETKQTLQRADELPNYTSTEISERLEQQASLRALLDECQNILGKMFNPMETNVLIGMVDYLQLSEDYILLLLAHCKRIEKKSLRQIERYAISLHDQGITSMEALEEKIQRIEEAHTLEGKVRSMFGLRSRALTSKEKKYLDAWLSYGYNEEMLRLAYEITVDATKEPSLPYANSILERWHAEGIQTPADVQREQEKRQGARAEDTTLGNSFDTDDFFAAALKRSFESVSEN